MVGDAERQKVSLQPDADRQQSPEVPLRNLPRSRQLSEKEITMRLAITKLTHVHSKPFDFATEIGTATGEGFSAEGRIVDSQPFGFAGYANFDIDRKLFDRLEVGKEYELQFIGPCIATVKTGE